MDTIFSLSSAQGKAGVSIIRVSGESARRSCKQIAGITPKLGQPVLSRLRDARGELIDKGLILYFKKGASFTGETTIEYHVHGSNAVINKLLSELSSQPKHREAMPGEFTRRALENGNLDISQIEGLSDLINSETEAQRKQAVRVFEGAIGKKVNQWRSSLIKAGSLIEATIDFADEEIPPGLNVLVRTILEETVLDLEKEIQASKVSERVRLGFEVAILGEPNVGKSTLINALAGREAAITSEYAGTTRDVIEVRMDLNGLPVTFLDTAGLRETKDEVECIGIKKAIGRAKRADLRIVLTDGAVKQKIINDFNINIDITVFSKADLTGCGVSGITGQGIPELIDLIEQKIKKLSLGGGVTTHERHRLAMVSAVRALKKCLTELMSETYRPEIAAEELRSGILALEGMVGSVGVEDFLDKIFSDFCIGK